MRTVGIALALALLAGVAWGRTFVENTLSNVKVMLVKDPAPSAVVSFSSLDASGTVVAVDALDAWPLLTGPQKVTVRACFNLLAAKAYQQATLPTPTPEP